MENNSTNIDTKGQAAQEQEIDLVELARKIWDSRKFLYKVCGIGAIIGIIVAFSIPKEYTATVVIAPESTGKGTSSSVSALAAMAGISLGSGNERDAIYPDLYPDVVSSTPFLKELFDVDVKRQKDSQTMKLADYMSNCQQRPWWSSLIGIPSKAIGWSMSLFKDKKAPAAEEDSINIFHPTPKEAGIMGAIRSTITVSVEKKTSVTTLSVSMQDPLVAATMVDTVRARLQEYITNYRTSKARNTLAYITRLYNEAQKNYYDAQEKYARYSDTNQGLITLTSRTDQEKLANERNLTFTTYTQVAQQLQVAKAQVDERTPVYTIIQPASVPLRPAKPNKGMILVGFVFLSAVGGVGWVLFLKDLVSQWKPGRKKEEEAE